jgi:hypothetical protein
LILDNNKFNDQNHVVWTTKRSQQYICTATICSCNGSLAAAMTMCSATVLSLAGDYSRPNQKEINTQKYITSTGQA